MDIGRGTDRVFQENCSEPFPCPKYILKRVNRSQLWLLHPRERRWICLLLNKCNAHLEPKIDYSVKNLKIAIKTTSEYPFLKSLQQVRFSNSASEEHISNSQTGTEYILEHLWIQPWERQSKQLWLSQSEGGVKQVTGTTLGENNEVWWFDGFRMKGSESSLLIVRDIMQGHDLGVFARDGSWFLWSACSK